jgi:hypothetical protein
MARKTEQENAQLRLEFNKILELAKEDDMAAIEQVTGGRMSVNNYLIVESACEATGLTGIPYIHFSTFQGWLNRGYCVDKGQKAVCSVPTIKSFYDKEKDSYYKTPRNSSLFHISQVKGL